MTAASPITVERHGSVLLARLDDGKANALSAASIAELIGAVDRAEADDTIGALAVVGRPGRFCAGFDLTVMRGTDRQAVVSLVSDGGELIRRLYGASVPVVAGCTGHALAAGALILLGCDLRLGADVDCKIGLNEVAIGMVLPDWAFTMAVERLDRSALQGAVAAAQVTGPAGAVRAGYLDEVVAADDLERLTLERATELAGFDARAYGRTIERLRGDTVRRLAREIAEDRSHGRIPGVD